MFTRIYLVASLYVAFVITLSYFFVPDGAVWSLIGLTSVYFIFEIGKANKESEALKKELTEKNNNINKLEHFIRSGLFNQIDEDAMKNLSFDLVDCCMHGNISDLPDNFLKFICDYDKNLVIFRRVILDKLDHLDVCLKKEREEQGKQNEVRLSRRNNVDDLLNKLNESAPKFTPVNVPEILSDPTNPDSSLRCDVGVSN